MNADLSQNRGKSKTVEELALGFLEVANETMCRPIRSLTEAKGHRTSDHDLAVFGGAGGQAACAIATNLGIARILIHRYSSVLSAYGMALADVVRDVQEPCSVSLSSSLLELDNRLTSLEKTAAEMLASDGFAGQTIGFEHFLNLRYEGSDTTFMVPRPDAGSWEDAFVDEHKRQFSFTMPGRDILVENVRVRATARSPSVEPEFLLQKQLADHPSLPASVKKVSDHVKIFFETGWTTAPLYCLTSLSIGDLIEGPAIILDDTQTIVVAPLSRATILERHVMIELERVSEPPTSKEAAPKTVDPVELSVMGHRFMSK